MLIVDIQLTPEQSLAASNAVAMVNGNGGLYRIGGYAGTGKTTVGSTIVEGIDKTGIHCAFTGKAALRLRQKGIFSAQTIHSAIYDFEPSTWTFHKKPQIEADYFLVDEGSMIAGNLWDDMRSYGLPIVVMGDPGQLEPVGNDPKLMHSPDIVMEHIHRQAAGSGIIQFATAIRHGTHTPESEYTGNEVTIIRNGKHISDNDLAWADICICGFNRTRCKINSRIRKMRGFSGVLQQGETIIILKNNKNVGVFNGQLLTVDGVEPSTSSVMKAKCHNETDEHFELYLFVPQFGTPNLCEWEQIKECLDGNYTIPDRNMLVIADYGYCITCHKSQGSEWDKVLVIDEQCPSVWSPRRWRYTAITRASKELRFYA